MEHQNTSPTRLRHKRAADNAEVGRPARLPAARPGPSLSMFKPRRARVSGPYAGNARISFAERARLFFLNAPY
ncbi:hypothetical protein EVAR_12342_1 [Eumeta japonica]|uniref:Uncharacterized protein n=1 Tax=Eumeta variegata TaxID=151549 RepID=A0A4C1X0H7_EUMVA|nr:hypothetical protein EVAR_12342_1 [Eumeta japonica]